jgi:hypothetical protein
MDNTTTNPKTIQEVTAEKITAISPTIADTVATNLAQIEINKRVENITKAIAKQDQLAKDLKKIDKNDVDTYVDGQPHSAMSKSRFEEIKKAKEKIDNLTKSIDNALTTNTPDAYNKLAETLKKLDNAGGDKKESSGHSE